MRFPDNFAIGLPLASTCRYMYKAGELFFFALYTKTYNCIIRSQKDDIEKVNTFYIANNVVSVLDVNIAEKTDAVCI